MTYLTTFFLILIYIIGAILAYGRAYAAFQDVGFAVKTSLFSWCGFVIGLSFWVRNECILQFRKALDDELEDVKFSKEYTQAEKEEYHE